MVGNFQKQWKCDRKKGEQKVEWKHGWWRRVIWGRKQGDRKEERCVFVGVCVWRGCAVLCGPLRWVQWQHMVRGWTACSLPNTLTQWGSVWWTWGMLRDGRTVEKEGKRGFWGGGSELGKGSLFPISYQLIGNKEYEITIKKNTWQYCSNVLLKC